MNTKTYKIKGMHCASCAGIIEKILKKQNGVSSAQVNFGTETAKISFDESQIDFARFLELLKPLGYSLTDQDTPRMSMGGQHIVNEEGHDKQEKLAELSAMKRQIISAIPLAILSVVVMAWDIGAEFGLIKVMSPVVKEFFHHLLPLIATYILFVVGKPYLLGVYRFFRYGKANMDTLIGLGTGVAYIYSFIVQAFEEPLSPFLNVEYTYYDVTIVVVTFIALGKYLEARSKLKTGDAIEKLLNLQAKTATVLRDGVEIEIAIDKVTHNDLIVVKPGGRIPVDGIVTEGESYVDESLVTGEPMPEKKKSGDSVVSGTINTTGSFVFRATKVGSETLLAHIIKMVENAEGSKAPIQELADRISAIFVPVVLVLSFITLGVWIFVGGQYLGFSQALSYGLTAFVGILVIACPCALGLATPTAIIVGVGKGANEGILIKDAATLQKLHLVNVVVVDKTGTLTRGKPELVGIRNYSQKTDSEIAGILASLESKSEHPLAHAISEYAKDKGLNVSVVSGFEIIKGKGIRGFIEGKEYFAGNVKLISDLKLHFDSRDIEKETKQGKTPIILAEKGFVIATVFVADAVKLEASKAVSDLRALGIETIMLTGDDANTAHTIADEVGIKNVFAEVLPEDKLMKIKELQNDGRVVAMAGDGFNDAPALAQADVGIAMGTGTDVAIETSGITLLHGDIAKLVKAVRLSRLTMRGIRQNLFWAFAYNLLGIPIAAGVLYPIFGLMLSPVFAGLAMALSSVSVVSNSLRLKDAKI